MVRFTPSLKQFKAYEYLTDSVTTFVGYGGAAFGGKSYLMCYWLVSMCLGYAGTGWGLGRKELVTLKRTTLITLFKVFGECNITPEDYVYNQQLNTITFKNGSQIFLIDMAYKPSDPLYQRFGGYELTGAAIDESAECSRQAVRILHTRINRRHNNKYQITAKLLETFNPDKGHVYQRYYKPFKEGKLKASYQFIPALPQDNPSPEVESYVAGIIANSDATTIERLIYGNFEFDDDPSRLMDYNAIRDLYTNEHVPEGKSYATIDVARLGRDNSVIMIWSGWRVIKVVSIDKCKITELYERVKDLCNTFQIPMSRVVADEDGVGGGLVDMLSCMGFVNGSKPVKEDGKLTNYDHLKSQCYFKLAKKVNDSGVYVDCISDIADLLTEELEQVKDKGVNSDNKLGVVPKSKVTELLGRSPDYSDSLMMRVYFELKDMTFTFGGIVSQTR